jgi:inorganic pyrophosphatase
MQRNTVAEAFTHLHHHIMIRPRLSARRHNARPPHTGPRTSMDLTKIPAGRNPPSDLHALIEIPIGGVPVKYEMDKASGTLFVDRFLHTAMFYPGNYGFIPQTLSEDGDPLDILVLAPAPVVPGAVVRCRPVGALLMKDQAGLDEKVLAVPVDALHPFYTGIRSYQDLPIILRQQVSHFFQHYKDLEKGKWTKIGDWVDVKATHRLIIEAIERAKNKDHGAKATTPKRSDKVKRSKA